jgi:hypothetical protein
MSRWRKRRHRKRSQTGISTQGKDATDQNRTALNETRVRAYALAGADITRATPPSIKDSSS